MLIAALLWAGGVAHADPLFEPPVIGKLRWGGGANDAWTAGVVGEARLLGVVYVDRLSAWPDRQRGIEVNRPEIVAGRIGGVLHLANAPLSFVARADLAELTQPRWGGYRIGAKVDAIADDLYVLWRPWRALRLVIGRARVPWSKLRQYEEVDLPAASVPFTVDRLAPDRRTGVMLHGDLGALAYALGAYEDLDALEPRIVLGDPSSDGQLLAVGHAEWTPIAPMMGSNPIGKIVGARGPRPTPRSDPWFDTARFSLGLGVMYRRRADATNRVDGSISVQVKWSWLAVTTEALLARDGLRNQFAAWGQIEVTPDDRVSVYSRAEWDGGAGAAGEWTVGGGATWHATANRRNGIGVLGWIRRDVDRGIRYDGVTVFLQAAL